MATLIIRLEGDYSDLLFIRDRVTGACEDVVEEYKQNLDEEVDIIVEMTG